MSRSLPLPHETIFRASPTPTLVLDVALQIVDANTAYLRTTGREREELVGKNIFEAFPENPDHPEADGVHRLRASIRRALDTGKPDSMWVQRYDIPSAARPGAFEERYWSPANTPILDADGHRLGILHTVEDVTEFRDHTAGTLAGTRLFVDLVAEVDQLREALTSRATIEQAKGILMFRNRCTAQEAFAMLSQRSQARNIKLRDVAAELVAMATEVGASNVYPSARR